MGVPSHGDSVKRKTEHRDQLRNETAILNATVTIQKEAIRVSIKYHTPAGPFFIFVAANDRSQGQVWATGALPSLPDFVMAWPERKAFAVLLGSIESAMFCE
jgi:hypothetical protein